MAERVLADNKHIYLIANNFDEVISFVIDKIAQALEVCNPGGLRLMIDDVSVLNKNSSTIGSALLSTIKFIAKLQDVFQIAVVSGDNDAAKKSCLQKSGLSSASIWFVGGIA